MCFEKNFHYTSSCNRAVTTYGQDFWFNCIESVKVFNNKGVALCTTSEHNLSCNLSIVARKVVTDLEVSGCDRFVKYVLQHAVGSQ